MYQSNTNKIQSGSVSSGRNKSPSKCELIDAAIKRGDKPILTSAEKRMYEQWKSGQALRTS